MELLLVLAGLAVILAVMIPAMGFLETGRIQAVVQDLGTLRQAADRWIERGRLDYTGVTVTALRTDGLLPSGWSATTPYGGAYTVAPATGDAARLTITVSGLSTSAGNTLVTYYTGRVQSVSLASGILAVTF